jgi:hypothetical protein
VSNGFFRAGIRGRLSEDFLGFSGAGIFGDIFIFDVESHPGYPAVPESTGFSFSSNFLLSNRS